MAIKHYTRNPIKFEAEQFLGIGETHEVGGVVERSGIHADNDGVFTAKTCGIGTLSGQYGVLNTYLGEEFICPGNYIIFGVGGRIESLRESTFLARYTEVV